MNFALSLKSLAVATALSALPGVVHAAIYTGTITSGTHLQRFSQTGAEFYDDIAGKAITVNVSDNFQQMTIEQGFLNPTLTGMYKTATVTGDPWVSKVGTLLYSADGINFFYKMSYPDPNHLSNQRQATLTNGTWTFSGSDNFLMAQYYVNYSAAVTTPAAVPVPAAAWLFGSGLMGLALARRKTR